MQPLKLAHTDWSAAFRSVIRCAIACRSAEVAVLERRSGQRFGFAAQAACAALELWKFCQKPTQLGIETTRTRAPGSPLVSVVSVCLSCDVYVVTLVICEVVVVQTSFVPAQIVT